MKYRFLSAFLFIIFVSLLAHADNDAAQDWQKMEREVRDGKIIKSLVATAATKANQKIKEYVLIHEFEKTPKDKWVFPLNEYSEADIGKGCYKPEGYSFYDGNKHGGHPAYDIFIKDKNFDCLDDRTGKAVEVVSISSGVVVSVNNDWKYPSGIRGGNYIYIYDDVSDWIFYYAHLDKVFMKTGQVIKAGDVIGTVGRSGKNAYPHRSPTHLHLMVLDADTMKPVGIYNK